MNLAISTHKELEQIVGHVVKRLALWLLLSISEGSSRRQLVSTLCPAASLISLVLALSL